MHWQSLVLCTLQAAAIAASSNTCSHSSSVPHILISTAQDDHTTSSLPLKTGVSPQPKMTSPKTIYLIRHAQSEENRRLESLQSVARSLTRFTWPRSSDMTASFELLSVSQQVDSPVSEFGKQQIDHMAQILRDDDFIATRKIELVAHSPLIRARETCLGMLGCMKSATTTAANEDDAAETTATSSSPLAGNVHELDLLKERTPSEWIPGNSGGMYQRIGRLEEWIAQRDESVLALVGHSQFFKAMLGMDSKFGNCDVMQVTFQPTMTNSDNDNEASPQGCKPNEKREDGGATSNHPSWWTNVTPVHLCRIQPTEQTTTSND